MIEQVEIAVILPCYNEEATVYVIDNNSTDNTRAVAQATGARVIREEMHGRGNAVRKAFSEIDADVY